MARSTRAMSTGFRAEGEQQQQQQDSVEASLPDITSLSSNHNSSTLRSKKSSHLAILKVLRKLRSPGNSDDEGDNDDDDSDLDFGCSGLKSFIEVETSKSSIDVVDGDDGDDELHISLPLEKKQLQNPQTSSSELPSRSASIADSTSSVSSISLSTPPTSHSRTASTRSSFSTSPTSPSSSSSTSSNSATSKKSFQAHGSSIPTSAHPTVLHSHINNNNNQPDAILEVAEEQQQQEEEEEESEEQAILRRQQEEQAAIEALEAYFAFRRASDTTTTIPPLPVVSTKSNSSNNITITKQAQKHDQKVKKASGITPETSKDIVASLLDRREEEKRSSSPSLLPYISSPPSSLLSYASSPYFEKYANEPLPILSMKNYNDISFTSSSVGEHDSPASPKKLSHNTVDSLRPSAAALRSGSVPCTTSNTASGTEAVIFPRPPLRTRRSEASLKDARNAETKAITEGGGGGLRRPSLATFDQSKCLNTNARPRGLTFSNSSPSFSSSTTIKHNNQEDDDDKLKKGKILESIPSVPNSPNSQIISFYYNNNRKTITPTSSNFLNLDLTPESPNFKIGVVLPSPPRSSSLSACSDWPTSSSKHSNLKSNNRCKPFVKKDNNDNMNNVITSSPTKVNFEPCEVYHNTLEEYRFPDKIASLLSINNSSSSSKNTTPAVSRSPSILSLSKMMDTNTNTMMISGNTTMTIKTHSPLGSATASRRGSLVSSPPPALRSRAGSLAVASVNGGSTTSRNAVYEYI